MTTPYDATPEAPSPAPAGPELVRMLMGALSGGGQAAAPTPAQTQALVDALRELVQSTAHARVFLERLILELRAENADLRSANAALRQVNDELRGRL